MSHLKKRLQDYYPFGMQMPGRNGRISGAEYRYAFNGMETDKEVSGTGNSYTTQFRQYDPRLGRWKSLDPFAIRYPNRSPFSAFNNNPIYFVDPSGLEGTNGDDGGPEYRTSTVDFTDGSQKIVVEKFNKQTGTWEIVGSHFTSTSSNISKSTKTNSPNRIGGSTGKEYSGNRLGADNDDSSGDVNGIIAPQHPQTQKGQDYLKSHKDDSDAQLRAVYTMANQYGISRGAWNSLDVWKLESEGLSDDINSVENQFESKKGGVISGLTATEKEMEKTDPYKNMVKEISAQFIEQYASTGGVIEDIDISVKPPSYSETTLPLLTIAGGTQQVDTYISTIYMDNQGNTWATIEIIVWDTYGVSEDDFTKYDISNMMSTDYAKYQAVGAFWILQHQRGYAPVTTKFNHTITIKLNE